MSDKNDKLKQYKKEDLMEDINRLAGVSQTDELVFDSNDIIRFFGRGPFLLPPNKLEELADQCNVSSESEILKNLGFPSFMVGNAKTKNAVASLQQTDFAHQLALKILYAIANEKPNKMLSTDLEKSSIIIQKSTLSEYAKAYIKIDDCISSPLSKIDLSDISNTMARNLGELSQQNAILYGVIQAMNDKAEGDKDLPDYYTLAMLNNRIDYFIKQNNDIDISEKTPDQIVGAAKKTFSEKLNLNKNFHAMPCKMTFKEAAPEVNTPTEDFTVSSPSPSNPEPATAEPNSEPTSTQTTSETSPATEEKKVAFAKVSKTQMGWAAVILSAIGLGFLLASNEKTEGKEQGEGAEQSAPQEKKTPWKLIVGGLACAASLTATYYWRQKMIAEKNAKSLPTPGKA